MSITIVQVILSMKVWECADIEGDRRQLQTAHIERVDASQVRVTCSDGFMLASVVYPATVAEDFRVVDIPAALLRGMAEALPQGEGCDCEDYCADDCSCLGDRGAPAQVALSIDTDSRVAEFRGAQVDRSAPFLALERAPFPDWRPLVRKAIEAWRPGDAATPTIVVNPELLVRASEAIGVEYGALRLFIPTSPSASILVINGTRGERFAVNFALVMPKMFTDANGPELVAQVARLVAKAEGKERKVEADAAKD